MQIQDYLAQSRVPFHPFTHDPTFGALRVAQAVDVSGRLMAKTVVVEADGKPVLAVLPANRRINMQDLRNVLDADEISLADEQRCQELFPDCELGALPPFGSPAGILTVMDRSLAEVDDMVFEGNRHDEAIRMKTADYKQIEHPLVADFSRVCESIPGPRPSKA